MDGETEGASKTKPFLLPCVRQWLSERKPVFVPISSRPQLVPQLSNWLISPQLSTHVIGVEAPGYHAGMPVELHLPHVTETQNKQNTQCKVCVCRVVCLVFCRILIHATPVKLVRLLG